MFLCHRISCDVYYCEYLGWLFLKYYCYDNKEFYYLTPRGDGQFSDLVDFLRMEVGGNKNGCKVIHFKCCDDFWKNKLAKGTLQCQETPEESDYLYLKENLSSLKHPKLRKKRQRLRRFLEGQTDLKTITIDESHRDQLLAFFDKWKVQKEEIGDEVEQSINRERQMLAKLLDYYDQLDCDGLILMSNEQTIAFTIGERVNDQLLVHFEKAEREIEGVYVYINKIFVEHKWFEDINYVNRQDDMGCPNLRQAKQSYLPIKMIKKYEITYQPT